MIEVNKLYNMDCLELMKQIPDESIDLICTDCPYHIVSGGCSTNTTTFKACSGMLNKTRLGCGNQSYKWETKGQLEKLEYIKSGKLFKYNEIKFEDWLPEIYRILKNDTHCYIMINARNFAELQIKAEKVGFKFQQKLTWDKGNAVPNRWYMNATEEILMLRKGKAKPINDLGTQNILRVPNIIGNKSHPTEKPVHLMEIMINNSTKEDEIVFDPFMGTGSTCVAALRNKRQFIGCELDENYYNTAITRIEETVNPIQYSLF